MVAKKEIKSLEAQEETHVDKPSENREENNRYPETNRPNRTVPQNTLPDEPKQPKPGQIERLILDYVKDRQRAYGYP